MRLLRTLTAVSFIVTGQLAHAQQPITVKFQAAPPLPAVRQFGYYLGPFTGTITSDPTLPTIDLFCIDILNNITWSMSWNVNVSSLGSTSIPNTRQGTASLDKYRQAAWLSTQFTTNPTTQWAGIQAAIWESLNPGTPFGGTSESHWLNQAVAFRSSAAWNTYNWDQFHILTPVLSAGRLYGGPQEFVTTSLYSPPSITSSPHVTPEPSTWLLMGTGLLGILGFAVLRGARV